MLVDTSVWVEHLRRGDPTLSRLLDRGEVQCHPFIIGELACGSLRRRSEVLSLLRSLPHVLAATDNEVLTFIERHRLMGRGVGWVDAHLLASAAKRYLAVESGPASFGSSPAAASLRWTAEPIEERPFMNETQKMYWGVACRTCTEMVALARVAFDAEGKPIPPPLPSPYQFEAECPRGHGCETYSRNEVIMFQGPAALEFQTHPAFQ